MGLLSLGSHLLCHKLDRNSDNDAQFASSQKLENSLASKQQNFSFPWHNVLIVKMSLPRKRKKDNINIFHDKHGIGRGMFIF